MAAREDGPRRPAAPQRVAAEAVGSLSPSAERDPRLPPARGGGTALLPGSCSVLPPPPRRPLRPTGLQLPACSATAGPEGEAPRLLPPEVPDQFALRGGSRWAPRPHDRADRTRRACGDAERAASASSAAIALGQATAGHLSPPPVCVCAAHWRAGVGASGRGGATAESTGEGGGRGPSSGGRRDRERGGRRTWGRRAPEGNLRGGRKVSELALCN